MTGKLERIEVWEYGAEDVWTLERVIPAGETTCDVTEEFPSNSRATYKIILVGEDSRRSMPCIITHNPDLPADQARQRDHRSDRNVIGRALDSLSYVLNPRAQRSG